MQGSANAPVLHTASFGRALPVLAASARFQSCCPPRLRSALRPTALRFLRHRRASLVPSLRPAALSHSLRLLTASGTPGGRPPLPQTSRTRPAQLCCVGFALLRRLRFVRPALPTHLFHLIPLFQGTATCCQTPAPPARRSRPRPPRHARFSQPPAHPGGQPPVGRPAASLARTPAHRTAPGPHRP